MRSSLHIVLNALCVSGGHSAAVIPIQGTRSYVTATIAAQVGTPLRTVWLQPDFDLAEIRLHHPDICAPFVPCIPASEAMNTPTSNPFEEDVSEPGLVDGVEPLVLGVGEGGYSDVSIAVRYVTPLGAYYGAHGFAGTLGLSPKSVIAQSNVIEVNTETLLHPDGSTETGLSIQLHPDGIVDEPGRDIVPALSIKYSEWDIHPVARLAGKPLGASTKVEMISQSLVHPGYFKLSVFDFPSAVNIVREVVGTVQLVRQPEPHGENEEQLFVPCLTDDEDAVDPLARLLSFNFGGPAADDIEDDDDETQRLYINIRHAPKSCYPPMADSVTVDGVQYCPTLLVGNDNPWMTELSLVPEMFEGHVTTFLDARNQRVVLRPSPTRRDPLPVAYPVPILPLFDLPDPVTGSVQFTTVAEESVKNASGWRLNSVRPNVYDDGVLSLYFDLDFYRAGQSPFGFFNVTDSVASEYLGEYTLVGDGLIDVSNRTAISLPVVLEGTGAAPGGQRYRLRQELFETRVVYTLTPVLGVQPPTPIVWALSYNVV